MATAQEKYIEALRKASKKVRVNPEHTRGDITDVIPSGLEVLDHHILGCGGFPCRQMTEIAADNGLGKSTLLLQTLANAQRLGKNVALIESESHLTRARAEQLGIDFATVPLFEPDSVEECLEQVEILAKAADPSTPTLVGIDSIAALPSMEEVKAGVTGKSGGMGMRARAISRGVRVLAGICADHNIALVIINQFRNKIGVVIGDGRDTVGGEAFKYHAFMRLQLNGGTKLEKDGVRIGTAPKIRSVKNKCVPPFRSARGFLLFDEGWHNERMLIEFGMELDIIKRRDMTENNLEKIRKVAKLALWDPLKIPEALEEYEVVVEKAAKKKSAKKKATKKKAVKKA